MMFGKGRSKKMLRSKSHGKLFKFDVTLEILDGFCLDVSLSAVEDHPCYDAFRLCLM